MKSDHRNVPDTMLSERPSGRNLLEGQEEAVGKAILDSGLIDEQRLFHALGLYLSERDEFVELYARIPRSEEHTSELQSLIRNSYAVFCLKKQKKTNKQKTAICERIKNRNK